VNIKYLFLMLIGWAHYSWKSYRQVRKLERRLLREVNEIAGREVSALSNSERSAEERRLIESRSLPNFAVSGRIFNIELLKALMRVEVFKGFKVKSIEINSFCELVIHIPGVAGYEWEVAFGFFSTAEIFIVAGTTQVYALQNAPLVCAKHVEGVLQDSLKLKFSTEKLKSEISLLEL
jgi:hypothetical protein